MQEYMENAGVKNGRVQGNFKIIFLNIRHLRIQGGQSGHVPTIRLVNGTWLPSCQRFLPHKNGTQPIVSVYFVFFQPHSTSELTTFTSLTYYIHVHVLY